MTSDEVKKILSILYVPLKASSKGDLTNIKSECKLLQLSVDDDILLGLQQICHSSESLAQATGLVGSLTEERLTEIKGDVEREQKQREISAKREKELAEQKRKAQAEEKRKADAEVKKTRQQLTEMAKQANYHEHISDFKILSSIHHFDLEQQVKKGMSNGWKPFGNLAVYHPGANPIGKAPDQFFQAMVKFKY